MLWRRLLFLVLPMMLAAKPPTAIEFVLSEKLWNRWVVIPFGIKSGVPLDFSQRQITIVVPESGFFAVSTLQPEVQSTVHFYVVDSKGKKRRVYQKKEVHYFGSTGSSYVQTGSEVGKFYEGTELYRDWRFFYGEEKALWGKDPNRLSPTQILEKHGIKTEADTAKDEPGKKD